MKKVVSIALAIIMMFTLVLTASTVFAVQVEMVDLGDYFNAADWNDNDHDITVTTDAITMEFVTGGSLVSFTGRAFLNELIEFTMDMDLTVAGWPSINFRTSEPNEVIWAGGAAYTFIFQNGFLEIQVFNNGNRWKGVKELAPHIVSGPNTIQVGAITTDAGVNLILNVNGVAIVNVLDAHSDAILDAGYISFFLNQAPVTLTPAQDVEWPPIAVNNTFTVETPIRVGAVLTGSYDFISNGVAEGDSIIQWYRSASPIGVPAEDAAALRIRENSGQVYDGPFVFERIDGANSLEYVLTEADQNMYLMFTVTPVDANGLAGYPVRTSTQFMDVLPYRMLNAICMLVESEFAFVNNVKQQIDPDNWLVAPVIIENRTLVPVRFIAESLGAEVDWHQEAQMVTLTMDGFNVSMVLGDYFMTVNGAEVPIDVSPQVIFDRTMLPLRAVAEAVGRQVFWDGRTQLIVISDVENFFDSDTEAALIDRVVDRILREPF